MQNIRLSVLVVCFFIPFLCVFGQEAQQYQMLTLAFYNLENLFDTENDPITYDDDRTPDGKDRWTQEIYTDKLVKMAEVIAQIGPEEAQGPPAIVGVAEIENLKVLQELTGQEVLRSAHYGVVHYDSPDRRGIDVGLLYNTQVFQVINSKVFELELYDTEREDKRIYTRDQLLVTGNLAGERMHVIVNHWPSRSGGEARTRPRRMAAAALNKKIMDSILSQEPYAKIVSMGDLNDDPKDKSLKKVLKTKARVEAVGLREIYNPMERMAKRGQGTLAYRDSWNLFDQILLSAAWLSKDYETFQFYKAGIFNKRFLQTPEGPYKGYPFRSFANGNYTGGYSDHFPVYIALIRKTD
ncbi:endonuclease/exonuclease/phosphatase family protein [Leeuwenhoekiella palythoae]|uniref:endonuclease/exonuclease/phosphatase family protein n=1 Tax=Leeuwenhoekiella palythoae TaxID=573501 RepID=UPI003516ECC3